MTLVIGALSLVVSQACGAPDSGGDAVTYTDSAGIEVITAVRPAQVIPDITQAATLLHTFQEADGYVLGSAQHAVRLSDGRVVFVDGTSDEVRAFVPGEGVRLLARRGGGPGEVIFPVNLQRLAGDSVMVYDRRQGRVTVFGPDGAMARELTIRGGDDRFPLNVFLASDGQLVATYSMFERGRTVSRSGTGELYMSPRAIVLLDREGVALDTVVVIDGGMSIETAQSSMAPVWGLNVPFDVQGNVLAQGSGGSYEYRILNWGGSTERIHRLALARRPVDRDSLGRILAGDERAMQMLGAPATRHPMLDPAFLPDSQPAFKSLRILNGGQVWLGSAEPFRQRPVSWQVLSATGEWLATVTLPAGAFLLDVADGHIVLGRTGAFDEQSIEVYATDDAWLRSPESGS